MQYAFEGKDRKSRVYMERVAESNEAKKCRRPSSCKSF